MSKENANQIRPGWVIEHNGKQYIVSKINLIQPGKGGAFIAVEMRDSQTGVKTEQRWRTADSVEKLMSEEFDCTYLYKEGDNYVFMNGETYDQYNIPAELLGESALYLQDNMAVTINTIEGKAVGVNLPAHVVLAVAETEPAIKNQTATNSYKPAILENGIRTSVPPFVNAGEKIVVATADNSYVERAK
ncbi:MAG: elongation factor P [Alphaproteobacteria bacterium]|nr:elongation factor P [Alphaproteobacteria bacterium]